MIPSSVKDSSEYEYVVDAANALASMGSELCVPNSATKSDILLPLQLTNKTNPSIAVSRSYACSNYVSYDTKYEWNKDNYDYTLSYYRGAQSAERTSQEIISINTQLNIDTSNYWQLVKTMGSNEVTKSSAMTYDFRIIGSSNEDSFNGCVSFEDYVEFSLERSSVSSGSFQTTKKVNWYEYSNRLANKSSKKSVQSNTTKVIEYNNYDTEESATIYIYSDGSGSISTSNGSICWDSNNDIELCER